MRSNDSIPKDEMLLAGALNAAWERHLGFTDGAAFRDSHGNGIVQKRELAGAVACCALGALQLAGVRDAGSPGSAFGMRSLVDVSFGNDHVDRWGWDKRDKGESLGWAFRCAMTQDISDPDTERLIRERSGK